MRQHQPEHRRLRRLEALLRGATGVQQQPAQRRQGGSGRCGTRELPLSGLHLLLLHTAARLRAGCDGLEHRRRQRPRRRWLLRPLRRVRLAANLRLARGVGQFPDRDQGCVHRGDAQPLHNGREQECGHPGALPGRVPERYQFQADVPGRHAGGQEGRREGLQLLRPHARAGVPREVRRRVRGLPHRGVRRLLRHRRHARRLRGHRLRSQRADRGVLPDRRVHGEQLRGERDAR
mmetsp:Transcript_90455/g.228031  ORF Transcript_90455/g.228031 Transcript_90455/m.228031 type:complete len:234 (+) Transcript_90455:489-1190(+)